MLEGGLLAVARRCVVEDDCGRRVELEAADLSFVAGFRRREWIVSNVGSTTLRLVWMDVFPSSRGRVELWTWRGDWWCTLP